MNIYLDESGDLGWSFDAPYKRGGSSRFLVIAALCVSAQSDKHPDRLLRHIYKHRHWNPKAEKKWVDMSREARSDFARQACKLLERFDDISCRAIVADKTALPPHVRDDANIVYNFMTRQLLLDVMAQHPHANLIPDARSVKLGSGNSLHDYLQTELWFGARVATRLKTTPTDSQHCRNLQFIDMIAGVIQSHYEFGRGEYLKLLESRITITTLDSPHAKGEADPRG